MKHYLNTFDAMLGAVLLYAQLLWLVMLAGLIWASTVSAYWIDHHWTWSNYPTGAIPLDLPRRNAGMFTCWGIQGIIFCSAIVFGSMLRSRLLNGRSITAKLYSAILVALLLCVLAAREWFDNPMHDLALMLFNGHGRWGCSLDGDYFFRDTTAPVLLVGPVLIAVAAHWVVSRHMRSEPATTPVQSDI